MVVSGFWVVLRDSKCPGLDPGEVRPSFRSDLEPAMQSIRSALRTAASLAGIVVAGAFAPSATIAQTACYVPGSGTVYRIKEPNTPTQCRNGHVEFQMSGGQGTAAAGGGNGGGGNTGAAGGDLSGNYPNPSVVKLQGQPISSDAPTAGQVLTFNGAAWTPKAAALPTNAVGAYDFSNKNGLLSTGTFGTGAVPASGAGVRMMWIPSKFAFRAGMVSGTQWDDVSIGYGSIAMGNDGVASQSGAISLGDGTVASGVHAIAIGTNNQATGNFSTALGAFATANGIGSFAVGANSVASANESMALGFGAKASAVHGTAFGESTVANGINSTVMGKNASTTGMTGSFVYGDASTATVIGAPLDNSFVVRAQHFWFGTTSAPAAPSGHLIETSTGAYLSTGGTWTNTSDANRKHAFKAIDGESILAKIDSMNVTTWSYNTEADSIRHMGPTAQDFRKAFGLGDTEKAIATVDADGVSLAAIKALIRRTTELRTENEALRGMLAEMARRLTDLEQVRR